MAALQKQGLIRVVSLIYFLFAAAFIVRPQPPPVPIPIMTVGEARANIRKLLLTNPSRVEAFTTFSLDTLTDADIQINADGYQFVNKGTHYEPPPFLSFSTGSAGPPFSQTHVMKYDDMDYVTVKKTGGVYGHVRAGTKLWVNYGVAASRSMADAQLFADSLNNLIYDYRGGDVAKEAADFEAFKAAAKAWRELSAKPELSDGAYREKVLAEEAFRNKDIDGAIAHYQAGLKLTPLWPQGYFNVALLCAEFGDFLTATRNMRRYLEMVPDAPDAKAAKDKAIIWEYKASQRKQPAPAPPSK